jgi:tetratricopeptide (TPR) repeat protein
MDRSALVHRCFAATLLALLALGCATAKPPQEEGVAAAAPPPKPAARTSRSSSAAEAEQLSDAQRRARMHYQVGVENLRQGRSPQAVAALLEAVRWDPASERAELALAEAYRMQGRNQETEAHLLRALQINPGFHQASLNLAALYIQTERYEAAIPHLQRLLSDPTFPGPWRALTNLGWAEYRLGRTDEAHRHLTMAVDYRADHWPARLNLGILEAERGNRAEAIAHFQRVLESRPGPLAEAEVRFRLAEQLESAGDRQGARRQLTTASDLEPGGPWSKRSAEFLKTLQ